MKLTMAELVRHCQTKGAETDRFGAKGCGVCFLLYHANDYMPLYARSELNAEHTMVAQIDQYQASGIYNPADRLGGYPKDPTLTQLASVLFDGTKASAQQQQMHASEVSALFIQDSALSLYDYSHYLEHRAVIVEAVLMHKHFHLDQVVIFSNNPQQFSCDYLTIQWGQANRFADPAMRSHIETVVKQVLTIADSSDYFDASTQVESLGTGIPLCSVFPQ